MIDSLFLNSDEKFWHQIDEEHSKREGVYKLVAAKDGKRIAVQRWLGNDEEGILYIGRATSFLNRVINLKKSIAPDYSDKSNNAGIRFKALVKVDKQLSYNCLYVELLESESPGEVEKALLLAFVEKFEELPPLNAIA